MWLAGDLWSKLYMRRLFSIGIAVFCMFLLCFTAHAKDGSAGRLSIFTSIAPSAYLVERIVGDKAEVHTLVGPGQDPHTFEPSPRLMAKLADSRVLFVLGFPFERKLVKKIRSTFKKVEIIDLQQNINLRPVTEVGAHNHQDGTKQNDGHNNHPSELDQHTWLDPRLAKIQAQTIAATLIRIDPNHKSVYEHNLHDLSGDLDAIHQQLTEALKPIKGKSFLVFHPAYGYFADAYGLRQSPVQIEGKEPSARQLARLIENAKKHDIKVIFTQPQFSKTYVQTLAKSINGVVAPLDDLSKDYLNNLKEIAIKLQSALKNQN